MYKQLRFVNEFYNAFFSTKNPVNKLIKIKYVVKIIIVSHPLIIERKQKRASIILPICHRLSGRNFMQIMIFPTKAKKRSNGLFIRRIYISSTKHSWWSVIFYAFFFSLFLRPLHALPFFYCLSHSLARFPVFPFLTFYELTVGRAHLACNFQNVE